MGRQSTLYGHVWDGRALWLAGLMENFRPSTLTFAGEGECSQLDSMTSIPQKPPNEDSKCLAKPLQVPGKRQVSAWQVPGMRTAGAWHTLQRASWSGARIHRCRRADFSRLLGVLNSEKAASEVVLLKSQAEVSNRLPVKKERHFPDFLAMALPFRCGGGGDRRRLAACRCSEKWFTGFRLA